MDTRERVLEVTADLLAASPTADISTRAVCEAAGIGAPLIYRQFGDKDGLLAAVVDHAFGQYLAGKRVAEASDDPVADLRRGWDLHSAFALAQPNIYRLMFSARVTAAPEAVQESFQLLQAVLERCAAAGRLRVSVPTAARMVMAANVGVALSLIARPAQYPDDGVSTWMRDAVFAAVLTDGDPADQDPAGRDPARLVDGVRPGDAASAASAAATLGARLKSAPSGVLSPAESSLLSEWLDRIADSAASS